MKTKPIIGNLYRQVDPESMEGENPLYILAQVTSQKIALISLTDGNRWRNPVKPSSSGYLNMSTWEEVSGSEEFVDVTEDFQLRLKVKTPVEPPEHDFKYMLEFMAQKSGLYMYRNMIQTITGVLYNLPSQEDIWQQIGAVDFHFTLEGNDMVLKAHLTHRNIEGNNFTIVDEDIGAIYMNYFKLRESML